MVWRTRYKIQLKFKIVNIQYSKVNKHSLFLLFSPKMIEFLRYLYYEEIQEFDANLAIQLLSYSDKYLQDDLYGKCMDYLTYNINSKNVYTILDFARQGNIAPLQSWCMKFLKNNLTIDDISELIKYLNQQQNGQEFAKENLELRDKAINFVIENYAKISQKEENFKLYEDFLKDNLTTNTNGIIAKFMYGQTLKGEARLAFQRDTANLKDSLYDFVKGNFQELKKKHITKKFPQAFWEDLVSCLIEKLHKYERKEARAAQKKEEKKDEGEKPKRNRKRKEKIQKDEPEGKPELKKTKKTQSKKKDGK